MFKKGFIIFSLLISLFIGITTIATLHKANAASKQLKETSISVFTNCPSLQEYFNSVHVQIGQKLINVDLQFNDVFYQLPLEKRFGYYECYVRNLRYNLQTKHRNYSKFDIEIKSKNGSLDYTFFNTVPDPNRTLQTDSTFYENGTKKFNKLQYYTLHSSSTKSNDDSFEKQVMGYAIHTYNLLTVGGSYYNFERDSKIIVDMVTDKFGITSEEYSAIYKEYVSMCICNLL